MKCYAIALESIDHSDDQWIEFYWADDTSHAVDQAEDAHPETAIIAVAWCPYAELPQRLA